MEKIRIDQFLDSDGKIKQLPGKRAKELAVLEYLVTKFELGVIYTEKQVNEICNQWHTFEDCCLLRRELIENRYLARRGDGTEYWRVFEEPSENEE